MTTSTAVGAAMTAAAVILATWALLVLLARRLPAGPLKDLAGFLPACVTLLRRIRADPRVPRRAKLAVALAGLWVLSPIDLIPEFLPVIGPLDDMVVVALALRYAGRRVPRHVLVEAWPADPSLLERLLGPSSSRKRWRSRRAGPPGTLGLRPVEGGRLPRDPEAGSFGVHDALAIAARVHAGQVDKAGRPYIEHVRRVADAVSGEGPEAVMAGLLHDVVEDGDLTLADLRAAGVPTDVISAVDALTKRPGEPYLEAVARARGNPLARVVKLADNADNAEEARLSHLDAATAARLRDKYHQARAVLQERPDGE